ncbi:folate-binding protein YgfZ [Thiohalocapsa marina]|uniref:Folate-binding protein YgfZ n=1 Tax=Thiohalocapsa marina TaxID=424902 RepID=A0A5M8FRP3_9GAMM|nr:folate-binding protein YgfZ [Thiohalocapsa marina]KAA6186956.1 folate-binding protein YgfZ [Thiohalocapsa marina]
MNEDWRAFLHTRSATLRDTGALAGSACFPGGTQPDAPCALTDLSHLGLIAVAGPDAEDFLQAQVSNDLRELSPQHTQLSSHCSAKGRMLANFRVLRMEQSLFLVLPRSQIAPLMKRLRLFVLRAQVSIEDASDALVCLGIIGSCADAALSHCFGSLPEHDNGLVQAGAASLVRVPGDSPRHLFIGPAEQARTLWSGAADTAVEADADLWALHDIRAGLPTVLPETSDTFVPQMTNMQLIDGISFTKGCYTGQEVVARMQYLGKLKRRMYVAEVETDQPPRPGDVLSVPNSRSGQAPGWVVNASPQSPGRYALLVVVEISAAEGGEVRLSDDGPRLRLSPPPYGLGES